MKKIALFISLALLLASCSTGTTPPIQSEPIVEETTPEPTLINIGVSALPSSYDPIASGLSEVTPLYTACYEGLFTYDTADGTITEGLCSDYTLSEDGLTYTFKLRDDAKYSNGALIVADDFVETFFRILDGEGNPTLQQMLADTIVGGAEYLLPPIERAEDFDIDSVGIFANGTHELEIVMTKPSSEFLQLLALPALAPTYNSSGHAEPVVDPTAEEMPDPIFVSSGAYYMINDDDSGITVTKNYHYYDMLEVPTDLLRFSEVNGDAALAFSEGRLDVIFNPEPELSTELSEHLYEVATFETSYIAFNLGEHPTNDAGVREALTLALDRDDLIEYYNIDAVPATGLVPPGVIYNGDDVSNIIERNRVESTSDEDEVEQALITAGYNDGVGLNMTMIVPATDPDVEIYRRVADVLTQNTGARIDFFVLSEEEYLEEIADGNFNITAARQSSDILNPSGILSLALSSSPYNISGYYDADFDLLLQEANIKPNFLQTKEGFQDAERHLIANLSFASLYHPVRSMIVAQDIEGYYFNAVGNLYVKNITAPIESNEGEV